MRPSHWLAAAAFAAGALAAPLAAAQNCAGFTDVPASSPFCPSVEWMKNRAITTGCGDGTTYCPDVVVSRLGMAAFMNRLGNALTPAFVQKREPGPAALNYAGEQIVCKTDPVVVSGYPRTALIRGLLNVFTPNGGMDLKAYVLYYDIRHRSRDLASSAQRGRRCLRLDLPGASRRQVTSRSCR